MIRKEQNNYNMILTERQQKYLLYYQVKLIIMNIIQVKKCNLFIIKMIASTKFLYSPVLGQKKMNVTKMKDSQGLINSDGGNLSHSEIFEKLFKGRLDEIIKLINETNSVDSLYYFKGRSKRKRFHDFLKKSKTS